MTFINLQSAIPKKSHITLEEVNVNQKKTKRT